MNKSVAAVALGAAISLGALAVPALATAAEKSEPTFTVYRSKPEKATELLDRAVLYMKSNSAKRAFAAFNNQRGMFHSDDLYVFVIGIEDGIMHAYGAAPEAAVGDVVFDLQDAAGKPIVRDMIEVVKSKGTGTVDYVWLNRVTNRIENKTSTVTRIGDYMIGVGFYTR